MKELFNFQEIILENERALLRPLTASDLQYLLPFALHEPEIWKYSLTNPSGEAGMQQYMSVALAARTTGKEYPFIVYDKQQQAYAGCTRYYDIQPAIEAASIGYTWYGKSFRQTGLNRHCKLLLLSFAFEEWGLQRVEFRANAQNNPSIRAMTAIGCKTEGILRRTRPYPNGTFGDSIVLSILKQEWIAGTKQELLSKTKFP